MLTKFLATMEISVTAAMNPADARDCCAKRIVVIFRVMESRFVIFILYPKNSLTPSIKQE
jgi:hypothetical protein